MNPANYVMFTVYSIERNEENDEILNPLGEYKTEADAIKRIAQLLNGSGNFTILKTYNRMNA
jgi:hypothetical protein